MLVAKPSWPFYSNHCYFLSLVIAYQLDLVKILFNIFIMNLLSDNGLAWFFYVDATELKMFVSSLSKLQQVQILIVHSNFVYKPD